MAVIGATELQPVNILGSYVQGLEGGRAARAQRLQEATALAQAQRDAELRNYLSTADLSSPEVQNQLMRFGKPGAEMAASFADIAGKRATAEKTGLEVRGLEAKLADDNYSRFQKTLGDLAYSEAPPTKNQVLDQLDFMIAQGTIVPQFRDYAASALPDDPMQLQAALRGQFLSQIPPAERAKLFIPMSAKVEAQKARIAGAGAASTKIENFAPAAVTAQTEFIKEFRETHKQLKTAPTDIANLRRAAELAKTEARKYMGTGGEAFLSAAKFLKNRLGVDVDATAIANAEEARTVLFQNVLNNLRKLDAQPSQQQQLIMQQALGSLDTDPDALPRVVQVYEDVIRGRVEQHNREFAEMKANPNLANAFPYSLEIKLPERAAAPPPSNSAGQIVDVSTPEEARKLAPGTRFRTPDGRIKVR
jgi:hypothetical protein